MGNKLTTTWSAEELYGFLLKLQDEICQTLGKALGWYPWYKDDQKNFPGATEADGVCVGEHVAESIADEAANEIKRLRLQLKCAYQELKSVDRDYMLMNELIEHHNKLVGKLIAAPDFKGKVALEFAPFSTWHPFTLGPQSIKETLNLISVHIPSNKLTLDDALSWLRGLSEEEIVSCLRKDVISV